MALAWWEREDVQYNSKGELQFNGHSVQALADSFGTPSFVYAFPRIKANLARMKCALETHQLVNHRIYYAMKANRFTPLLTALQTHQMCGIDACSPNEVMHAISCGFAANQISMTAGSLSTHDFDVLLAQTDLHVNCDSLHAISTIGQRSPGRSIGIRINPEKGISRQNNEKLQYAGTAVSKFGVYLEQFEQALALAKQYDLTVSTLHFHTGCGYLSEQLPQLRAVLNAARPFVSALPNLQSLNIGGGLGVRHTAEDSDLNLDAWASLLSEFFGQDAPWAGIELQVEPGDYIVKDAGLLLLEKTYTEQKRNQWFLGTNAGFNIAPEPAHYRLPFQPVPILSGNKALQSYCVTGNINEALDIWSYDAWLPDMTHQSHIALINAGAYSSSMASNHCMRGGFSEFLLF